MTTSGQRWYWKLGLTSFLVVTSGALTLDGGQAPIATWGGRTLAQITPDTTLGSENSVVTPNVVIDGIPSNQIDGGAIRGINLFHSFEEFNIDQGRGAFFTNPAGIENILSRVMGNNPSNILGKLGVLGDANFFLINPNGIIFGANASLDVRGSFVATTANAIGFGSQGFFSASAPNQPELLTVNPAAFFFNQIAGQSIANQSTAGLQVPSGQSLLLVGGDVRLDGGQLTAPGGRVELGGLASFGTVGLNFEQNNLLLSFPVEVPRANVSLTNGALVDVTAGGGGSIAVSAKNLDISGGSSLLAGIGAGLGSVGTQAGNIEIDATERVSISGTSPTGSASRISSLVNIGAIGNAGNVVINTGSLNLIGNAGIASATNGQGNAGSVTIQARDVVSFTGSSSSGITSAVGPSGVGNGSDVNIQTRSLSLSNGALLFTATLGQGNAGNVQVNAADSISVSSGSLIGTITDGQGNGGNVTLNAGGTVSFDGVGANNIPSNAASLVGDQAVGNGGNLSIQARSLFLTNSAYLTSETAGRGNAGNVSVQTDDSVSLANSMIRALVQPNAVGQSGNINIQTRSLSLTDGTQLSTSTFGQGDAGDIEVNTTDSISVSGGSMLQATTLAQGDAGDISITAGDTVSFDGVRKFSLSGLEFDSPSGAVSFVTPAAVGMGGEIKIQARSLSLTDGAQLATSTAGQGNAGNIQINATNSVFVSSGAIMQAITYGQGNGGDISIAAGDQVSFDGVRTFSFIGTDAVGSSAVSSSVGPSPRVGASLFGFTPEVASNLVEFLPEATANLAIVNLSELSILPGNGKGGDISIQANSFSLTNGAIMTSGTLGQGDAGSVSVQTDNFILLENGLIGTTVEQSGVGNGGNINLQTGELSLTNSAEVSASSNGAGDAGNLDIAAGSIQLDARGKLTAQTASGDGGDINLKLQDLLLLRRNSQISTTAGTAKVGGDGGNITIDTQFLVAVSSEDSNITANAFEGLGGNVRITTQGIFGIQFQEQETPLSDITASSDFGVDGTVEINTLDVDPSQGLVDLPTVPVATEVAQACTPGSSQQQSEFVVTGRGGLPPNPGETLNTDAVQVDLITLNPQVKQPSATSISASPTSSTPTPIVEAQGWAINANGEVILTANAPTVTPHSSWQKTANCQQLEG